VDAPAKSADPPSKINDASENIEDRGIQSSSIITPKRLSDMNENATKLLSAGKAMRNAS